MVNKHERFLTEQFDFYETTVMTYARKVFEDKIKPWLQKYHLVFLTGNGAYWMGFTKKTPAWFVQKYKGYYEGSIDTDRIDSRIRDVLESSIPGFPGDSLGTIMPCYVEERNDDQKGLHQDR